VQDTIDTWIILYVYSQAFVNGALGRVLSASMSRARATQLGGDMMPSLVAQSSQEPLYSFKLK
jgi:hypothetical protein